MTEPPEEPGHTRWLAYAQEDLDHAESTLDADDPIYRWVCVAAPAEKAFKATLIRDQIEFPRIHDLERLRQLLPAESALRDVDVDLASLTEWSIAGRYPADAREADRADVRRQSTTLARSSCRCGDVRATVDEGTRREVTSHTCDMVPHVVEGMWLPVFAARGGSSSALTRADPTPPRPAQRPQPADGRLLPARGRRSRRDRAWCGPAGYARPSPLPSASTNPSASGRPVTTDATRRCSRVSGT